MYCAENGPVAGLLPKSGQGGVKVLLRDLPQDALAKVGADFFQLTGDGGVLVRQVRVVRAAVDDAQGVSGGGEVEVDLLHYRVVVVGEIDGHHAAHRGAHLVQQSAGLAEIDVLGVLSDLGQLDGRALVLIEQAVENIPQQHLQGRAGAEAAALKYAGGSVDIETLQPAAPSGKPGGDTPEDGDGAVVLLRMDLQIAELHHVHGEPFALQPDDVLPIGGDGGNDIQIHTACQYPAVLVVGMVAADLRAAWRGEYGRAVAGAERLRQALQNSLVTLHLRGQLAGAAESGSRLLQLLKILLGRKCTIHSSLLF